MNPKEFLIVVVAVALVIWLLSPHDAGGQRSHMPPRHGEAASIGARNHSGVEPYDLFGLRPGRDADGGRDLPDNGGDR